MAEERKQVVPGSGVKAREGRSAGKREVHPLVQAENMLQLAFMIPAGTMVGWLFGLGLDHLLHQRWIYIAGLLLGATAGFIQLFRTVLHSTKE